MHDGYATFIPCSSTVATSAASAGPAHAMMPRCNGQLRGVRNDPLTGQLMVQHPSEQIFVASNTSVGHQNAEERRRAATTMRNGIVTVNGGGGGNVPVDIMSVSLPNVDDVCDTAAGVAALEPSKSLSGGDFARRIG